MPRRASDSSWIARRKPKNSTSSDVSGQHCVDVLRRDDFGDRDPCRWENPRRCMPRLTVGGTAPSRSREREGTRRGRLPGGATGGKGGSSTRTVRRRPTRVSKTWVLEDSLRLENLL